MDNKFCVYFHRDSKGEIFYVGEGTERRPYSKNSRNKAWHEIAVNGFTVEIVEKGLSKKDSQIREKYWIDRLPNLVNSIHASTVVLELEYEKFNEWFYVDPESPTGLRWKKDNNANSPMNRKFQGDVAGTLLNRKNGTPSGYQLSLNAKRYYVHRVVWLLSTGSLDSNLVIDHIDNNPLNNKITNLRQTTHKGNANNLSLRLDNVSGVKGVSYCNMSGNWYYSATWCENNKSRSKNFSVKRYGKEKALEMAIRHRKEKYCAE